MKLSVPLIPDRTYIKFLTEKIPFLESVYFGLHSGPVLDSRHRFSHFDTQSLVPNLEPLEGIKKYVLLNTRFIMPNFYTDERFLTQLLDTLESLYDNACLNGIVVSDFYLINALDRTGHDIVPALEVVPGINSMMDSLEKILSHMEMIENTRFKLPGKLILDRSLNRDPEALHTAVLSIKSFYPGIKIELLANEGCIYNCPFKPAHDAQISLSNTGLVKENTHGINQAVGCHAYFHEYLERFFKSPFIRPEDIIHYKGIADTIKICGRTLGTKFLTCCIYAYCQNSYCGNLFDLMDSTHFLGSFFHIDNKSLGSDFFKKITTCTKICKNCRICHDLFLKSVTKKPITLKPYEDYL
jgi:collagenase-like PrtC family protease